RCWRFSLRGITPANPSACRPRASGAPVNTERIDAPEHCNNRPGLLGPRLRARLSGERTQVIHMTQLHSTESSMPKNAAIPVVPTTCGDSGIFPRTAVRLRGDDTECAARIVDEPH